MNIAFREKETVKTAESDREAVFTRLENLAKTYVLSVSEDENIFYGSGRKGRIPDVVIFGRRRGDWPCDGKNMPHYVIYRDGSVRQFVGISDVSGYFETPDKVAGVGFEGKGGGLVFCRRENVALYSVSVVFDGDRITDTQILSAAALLRLISLKLLRLYGKKLPSDNNHIIPAAALNCGYECETDTALITELCKLRPV